ncbi:hypothetical protein AKJ41_04765 [candidate division MSBL1 archaeon SCGC-AAA259O05]|uniref:Transposase IS4-like domain-containing protein n=1 Tax=candidate division MSBL1 archaeon SCGC-AAA259O05 TaxID=1698271 RepID=A0A133V074_9EURY|nr:hypothetical protein AKJ41_04765 [candidate division MSBL1 archaeon SCGC-AAA259O05]
MVRDLDLGDCLADGVYNSSKIFELLEEKGVDPPPGVKLRKDANTGLSLRGQAAKEFRKLGYEEWKEEHDYGKRWSDCADQRLFDGSFGSKLLLAVSFHIDSSHGYVVVQGKDQAPGGCRPRNPVRYLLGSQLLGCLKK